MQSHAAQEEGHEQGAEEAAGESGEDSEEGEKEESGYWRRHCLRSFLSCLNSTTERSERKPCCVRM